MAKKTKSQKYCFRRVDGYGDEVAYKEFKSEDEAHKFFLSYFGGTVPVGTIANLMERGELTLRDNGEYDQLYFERI